MTIFALSTHPGRAAVAVIRVSGQASRKVLSQLTRRPAPKPRVASLCNLYDPDPNEKNKNRVLDQCLALYFEGPKSYTGEDLVEFHVHGGKATVGAVMKAIGSLSSASEPIRLAEPGEFTLSAFRNRKMDLTQVEALRDVIDAETETQRRLAQNGAMGANAKIFEHWRTEIVKTVSLLTALIDFADDNAEIEGSSFHLGMQASRNMQMLLQKEVNPFLCQTKRNELLASGITMSLIGAPNAGKSSILNKLTEREAAIVSELPGTTRDIVQVAMDIDGYKVVVNDTAGLRRIVLQSNNKDETIADTHNRIELFGMEKARQQAMKSDIIIGVVPVDATSDSIKDLAKELETIVAYHHNNGHSYKIIIAVNKTDLNGQTQEQIQDKYHALFSQFTDVVIQPVSCKAESGIDSLIQTIASACHDLCTSTADSVSSSIQGFESVSISQRARMLVETHVKEGLEGFLTHMQQSAEGAEPDIVYALAELQLAVDGISRITGRGIGVEEVLGNVFSTFCIGK